MSFSRSIIDIINQRSSWRTYSSQLLDDDTKKKINQILTTKDFNSLFSEFAGKSRFELIESQSLLPMRK